MAKRIEGNITKQLSMGQVFNYVCLDFWSSLFSNLQSQARPFCHLTVWLKADHLWHKTPQNEAHQAELSQPSDCTSIRSIHTKYNVGDPQNRQTLDHSKPRPHSIEKVVSHIPTTWILLLPPSHNRPHQHADWWSRLLNDNHPCKPTKNFAQG